MSYSNEGTSLEHGVLEPDSRRVYRNEYGARGSLSLLLLFCFRVSCREVYFNPCEAKRRKNRSTTSCDNVALRRLLTLEIVEIEEKIAKNLQVSILISFCTNECKKPLTNRESSSRDESQLGHKC